MMDYSIESQNVKRRKSKIQKSSGKKEVDMNMVEDIDSDSAFLAQMVTSQPKKTESAPGLMELITPPPLPPAPAPRPRVKPKVPKATTTEQNEKTPRCLCTAILIGLSIIFLCTSAVFLGILFGVTTNCSPNSTKREVPLGPSTNLPLSSGNKSDALCRYVFNFTTTNQFSIFGHREVLYCHDVRTNGTLCDSRDELARTMFISAKNTNMSTNRLISEVYLRLQDLLNWTSGGSSSNNGWDRLHQILDAENIDALDVGGEYSLLYDANSDIPSSSDTLSCSQRMIYVKLSSLIQVILQSSSSILTQREATALSNVLDVMDEDGERELGEVFRSKGLLGSSLEMDLIALMKMLAGCSSLAWRSETTCAPCSESVVISSRYPRIREISPRKIYKVGSDQTSLRRSRSRGDDGKEYTKIYTVPVLDTLVLNLRSAGACDC